MAKQCVDCRQILDEAHFGMSRSTKDQLLPYCKLCVNQAKRVRLNRKVPRLRPPPPEINDDVIRNNLHHLRQFLSAFFHSLDYSIQGPCLDIPNNIPLKYTIQRVPNSSLVEVRIMDNNGQPICFHGVDRLKENAIESLSSVLRDYRLEPNDQSMQWAKLYIYDKV